MRRLVFVEFVLFLLRIISGDLLLQAISAGISPVFLTKGKYSD